MDVARLESIPLFANLSEAEREHVASLAAEVEVPPGRALTSERDPGHSFFVIEEGAADVVANGRRLAELGPGDFFGEIALLATGHRTASVIATSPMRLITLFEPDFRRLETRLPRLADELREAMRERLSARRPALAELVDIGEPETLPRGERRSS